MNLRPLRPERSALAKLSYSPKRLAAGELAPMGKSIRAEVWRQGSGASPMLTVKALCEPQPGSKIAPFSSEPESVRIDSTKLYDLGHLLRVAMCTLILPFSPAIVPARTFRSTPVATRCLVEGAIVTFRFPIRCVHGSMRSCVMRTRVG